MDLGGAVPINVKIERGSNFDLDKVGEHAVV